MFFIIIIYITILTGLIIGMILNRTYEKNFLHTCLKKEHPLLFLYPLCLYIFDKFELHQHFINQNTKEALESLNIGEKKETQLPLYWCKKCSFIIALIFLISIFSLFNELNSMQKSQLINGNAIQRPTYGEGEKKVRLYVEVEDKKDSIKDELNLNIEERRYDNEAMLKSFEEARKYIDLNILGENESLDDVRKPLVLMKQIPGTSIKIKWKIDNKNIIDTRGDLNNSNIPKEGELVQITAQIEYFDTIENYLITLRVKPKIVSRREQVLDALKEAIENKSRDTITEKEQILPEDIGERKINYNEPENRESEKMFFIGIIITGFIYFLFDKELLDQYKKREMQVLMDYPEIVNKIVLLLGAGMTMKNAWGKVVKEYVNKNREGAKNKRFAYEEMIITYNELHNGVIEMKAYESYGKRMKVLPYLRFSSLISQNLKKGSKGLLELLEYEAMEAFNERKELAKRLGEEASTKLLLPMMLMLLIVLVIILVPAISGL
ncbi:type II secretion system protein F (GspF) [Mobilisporobacter senegalensis]|uniref:Type II secretion system protein F (GspF) n=1 Tax=Mobilisporobacter senegalensis TaxID=1329262 RepID=A0A3N1XAA4_9FIRM|nr:type II secretion system protein F (GspF) [Mobilisporobacter senegalensis]